LRATARSNPSAAAAAKGCRMPKVFANQHRHAHAAAVHDKRLIARNEIAMLIEDRLVR